jgi:hypothetical protein
MGLDPRRHPDAENARLGRFAFIASTPSGDCFRVIAPASAFGRSRPVKGDDDLMLAATSSLGYDL